MWSNKKISFLFVVFVLTGVAVLLTRLANDQHLLARIRVVPHDGSLVSGGQQRLAALLVDSLYSGVFYEQHSHHFMMPFPDELDSVILQPFQVNSSLKWHNITPDTLFLRAFSLSYANMLYKVPAAQTDSLNQYNSQNERLRRLAVLAKGPQRDTLLLQLHAPIDQWTAGQSDKLRKRYVNQLLAQMSKKVLTEPGKAWILLVDVEHYADLKVKIKGANRFEWMD
ncbi:MAG: hypothetical protein Q8J69_08790 [Sphingobacteriaceae bacterium]|nr:hypothetical protein [Sphingobacteriaceae bacterium]